MPAGLHHFDDVAVFRGAGIDLETAMRRKWLKWLEPAA